MKLAGAAQDRRKKRNVEPDEQQKKSRRDRRLGRAWSDECTEPRN